MTDRNPIPACLSHLEQMRSKAASKTAMHYLINDLRNYAKILIDGDSDSQGIIAEDAGEAMQRAADSLEAMMNAKND